jgi:hypothetical protein
VTDPLNDDVLDRELRRALAVDPSPEFAVRVRQRIAVDPPPRRPVLSVLPMAVTVAIAAAVWVSERKPLPQPQVAVLRSVPLSNSVKDVIPSGTSRAHAVSMARRTASYAAVGFGEQQGPSGTPILIDQTEARAIRRLIEVASGRPLAVSPMAAVMETPVERSFSALDISPIVIEPLALSGEGERQ